ncbi:MAG: phosphoglucomutase/phosphomannomutase family protein [Actinomycetota bacterium]|nr:phosphoglucomutase/phosphomannomutase family protein [Actinomycetota bacterium]
MKGIKFGTDGWRAVMCDTFTLENVRVVAQAIADFVLREGEPERGLVIGHDTRFFAEEFASACASVLLGNEIPVYLARRAMPTPITAYCIKLCDAAGAIMLTASHNPPEYNGIKFIPEYAGPATPEITSQIERNIERIKESGKILQASLESTLIHYIDPLPKYIDRLKNLVDFEILKRGKLKVVLDPMYGAGQGIMAQVFKEAGCSVHAIHDYRDVLFGGTLPDPTSENLRELSSLVRRKEADLGLALDGDGDRFGVIDSNGVYLSPNRVLPLVGLHLLKEKGLKGIVVRSIATTHMLDVIARRFGVQVVETPVGFKYIGQIMREKSVVLGGEESGGLSIMGHIPEKDGILADLLVAEIVAHQERPLSELLEGLYAEYGDFFSERLDVEYPRDKKVALLETLKSNPPLSIGGLKLQDVLARDGVKYLFEGGDWILIRPSGTEPLVRVYIETHTKEKFHELKKYAQRLLDHF